MVLTYFRGTNETLTRRPTNLFGDGPPAGHDELLGPGQETLVLPLFPHPLHLVVHQLETAVRD